MGQAGQGEDRHTVMVKNTPEAHLSGKMQVELAQPGCSALGWTNC